MGKRSRGGCRECKRSRIKCDEARPFCGTCARRDRNCPGYATPGNRRLSIEDGDGSGSITLDETGSVDMWCSETVPIQGQASSPHGLGRVDEVPDSYLHTQLARVTLPVLPGFSDLDKNDQVAISYYFQNHLRRVGLGEEFVEDGNGKVLTLLQQYPDVISDMVFALGHTHVSHIDSKSVVPALTRKSKALAKLRSSHDAQKDIEPKLLLALGLGALELIDTASIPQTSSIPALIAYTIHMVAETAAPLGDLAKYFIRGLARQDIIFSLTYRRRNLIPTSLWFDSSCYDKIDRFLGLTMSLIPLLEELCSLAADIKNAQNEIGNNTLQQDGTNETTMITTTILPQDTILLGYNDRVQTLQYKLSTWRPFMNDGTGSFLEKRKYLLQAQAFRSAALLYLYRLCHPAGASPESDTVAINMAYDVLLSCHEEHADVRMILWPLFVCGCEMKSAADRQLVLGLLDRNHRERGTYTPLRTTEFLVQRLWPAVDAGSTSCNWMDLVEDFPGDFAPL